MANVSGLVMSASRMKSWTRPATRIPGCSQLLPGAVEPRADRVGGQLAGQRRFRRSSGRRPPASGRRHDRVPVSRSRAWRSAAASSCVGAATGSGISTATPRRLPSRTWLSARFRAMLNTQARVDRLAGVRHRAPGDAEKHFLRELAGVAVADDAAQVAEHPVPMCGEEQVGVGDHGLCSLKTPEGADRVTRMYCARGRWAIAASRRGCRFDFSQAQQSAGLLRPSGG